MLLANGAVVQDENVPDGLLPVATNLRAELGGRMLLRYVRADAIAAYTFAAPTATWPGAAYVTPTAYCARELPAALHLPPTLAPPTHAVLLRPDNLFALGPRRVRFGTGVEYVLPNGFAQADLAWPNWPVVLS